MKRNLRFVTVILALLLLTVSVCSCASQGKTLITMSKDGVKVTFPVKFYELMLSRWKGQLVSGNFTNNGFNAEQDGFYEIKDKFDGETLQSLGDYYGDLILENCKNFTAVLWLFDSMGLSLTDEQIHSVDQRLGDLLDAYGDGSKTKLNSILANYGVNYNLLRDFYLMEEKIDAVQIALYGSEGSKLGYEVKEQFLAENYVHFKQIFLPYFRYVYKTDANGDQIYYVKESQTARICYDESRGYTRKDANGIEETDANGDTVYYTSPESNRIAYDTEKGIRSFVLNKNGEATTEEMTKEEIEAVIKKGAELFESLKNCTDAEFEAAMTEQNKDQGEETYTDGYYLQKNIDYAGVGDSFAYFTDIITAMDSMEVGSIAEIRSDSSGYHIVMKYAPTPKAYESAVNEVWFKNFKTALVEELFREECQKHFADMSVDPDILATASDIKKIGVNLYY